MYYLEPYIKGYLLCIDDKRLDEWLDLDRFDFEKDKNNGENKTETESNTDRKITRNQKRKNEITCNVGA